MSEEEESSSSIKQPPSSFFFLDSPGLAAADPSPSPSSLSSLSSPPSPPSSSRGLLAAQGNDTLRSRHAGPSEAPGRAGGAVVPAVVPAAGRRGPAPPITAAASPAAAAPSSPAVPSEGGPPSSSPSPSSPSSPSPSSSSPSSSSGAGSSASVVPGGPLAPLARALCGAQLALWDNLVGPKIEAAWDGTRVHSKHTAIQVARHTLDGELCRPDNDPNIEVKFNVVKDLDAVISSAVFAAQSGKGVTKMGLSFVFPAASLARYLDLYALIDDEVLRLGMHVKRFMDEAPALAVERLEELLPAVVAKFEAWFSAVLPMPNFGETAFCRGTYDPRFLARAITSHLHTHGCSVVVGSDRTTVNNFIDTLAVFLSDKERRQSSHVPSPAEGRPQGYVPGLFLQGIVLLPGASTVSVSERQLIEAPYPTTLIDIDEHKVRRCKLFNDFSYMRKEFLAQGPGGSGDWMARKFLQPVTTSATLVVHMLTEMRKLPLALRQAYLEQQNQLLVRKTVLMIKVLEKEVDKQPSMALQKKLMRELDIPYEADLSVLAALAEKLVPHTYNKIAGDRARVEEYVVNLIDGF